MEPSQWALHSFGYRAFLTEAFMQHLDFIFEISIKSNFHVVQQKEFQLICFYICD